MATDKSLAILLKYHKPLLTLAALGTGSAIGLVAAGSSETAPVITSLLVITLLLLLTFYQPLYGFLLWLFGAALLDSWVEIPFGAGLPDLSFNRFAILFLLLALLLPVLSGRAPLPPLSFTDLCMVFAPIGFALAARLSPQPMTVVQTALSLHLVPALAYFFAKHLIQNKADLNKLLWVIAGFGIFAGAYALYEALTGQVLFLAKGQELLRQYRGETQLRLIIGLIGSTGGMGRVLVTTLLVTLYLIMESPTPARAPLLMGGALVQFGGLLMTYSRTPILALLVGLFVLQFWYPRLRGILLVGSLFVALNLAANWQQIQATEVAQDRLSRLDDYNGRSTRWQTGLTMWLEKPVQGWGLDSFESLSGQYRADNSTKSFDAVENDFLYLLVGTGLIGFVPYALFLLLPLLKSITLFFQAQRYDWPGFIHERAIVLYWVVLLCFLIGSFTARNVQPIIKLLPFALTGAIVGSQEMVLRRRPLARFYGMGSTMALYNVNSRKSGYDA